MKGIILPAILIILVSCDKDSKIMAPDLTGYAWENITYQQTDYNLLIIKSAEPIFMTKRIVKAIDLYRKDLYSYNLVGSYEPTYEPVSGGYDFSFEIDPNLDSTDLVFASRINYIIKDGDFEDEVEVEKYYEMIHYPYASAKVHIWGREIQDPALGDFTFFMQDFDLSNLNTIYFHPFGSYGLFQFDNILKKTEELYSYGSGDFISCGNDHIFIDDSHHILLRFNIKTGETDIDVSTFEFGYGQIYGMDYSNNTLFVLTRDYPNEMYLLEFDSDLNLLKATVQPYESGSYFEIDNNIAYVYKWPDRIHRLDLGSMGSLPSLISPVYKGGPIRINEGNLYYVDYDKAYIGVVPLADLQPADQ
jgi:hypothetical protein